MEAADGAELCSVLKKKIEAVGEMGQSAFFAVKTCTPNYRWVLEASYISYLWPIPITSPINKVLETTGSWGGAGT